MQKRAPRNTTKDTGMYPGGFILDALTGGASRAIEAQEADGQRQLASSTTLPTDMGDCKPALESLGFKFLGPVEGDHIFQYVEFPEGWKIQPTDHSMWSNLVDPDGCKRASIFYKAAFYDRSAHMRMERFCPPADSPTGQGDD